MIRSEKIRLVFWLTVLGLIISGLAIQALTYDVCVSAMIQDETSVTYYGVTCK